MTAKKDLKRRVRARQARTGEAYVTALCQVQAGRPAPISVVELLDATQLGARVGWRCRVAVFPTLALRVAPARLVGELARILAATAGDPALELMRAVVLQGEPRTAPAASGDLEDLLAFLRRARAGIGGVSAGGRFLAATVDGQAVLFRLSLIPDFAAVTRAPALVIGGLEPADLALPAGIRDLLAVFP
jgi:hypothetical protein